MPGMRNTALAALVLAACGGEQALSSESPAVGPRLAFGTVLLCRDAIQHAQIVEVPRPDLAVIVNEQARQSIERETTVLVGKSIRVSLDDAVLYQI